MSKLELFSYFFFKDKFLLDKKDSIKRDFYNKKEQEAYEDFLLLKRNFYLKKYFPFFFKFFYIYADFITNVEK